MWYQISFFKKYQHSNLGHVSFLITTLYFNMIIEIMYFDEFYVFLIYYVLYIYFFLCYKNDVFPIYLIHSHICNKLLKQNND